MAVPRVHHPAHASTRVSDGMEQQATGGYATEQTPGLAERLRRAQEQEEAAKAPPKANDPAHASPMCRAAWSSK
eukprot:8038687-Pyramimonas_sp.AAC.1